MQNDSTDSSLDPSDTSRIVEPPSNWYKPNCTTFKSLSTFDSQQPPKFEQRPSNLPIRGGVQVLPPIVPPRSVNGTAQPVATPRPKPKPPVPPKRDELTRLTTVKRDPTTKLPPSSAPTVVTNAATTATSAATESNSEASNIDDKVTNETNNETSSESITKHLEINNTAEEGKLNDDIEIPQPDVNLVDPHSPSSEEGATADIWVRAIDSPVKKSSLSVDVSGSRVSSRNNSTSDEADINGAKPIALNHHYQDKKDIKHKILLDNSYLRFSKNKDDFRREEKTIKVDCFDDNLDQTNSSSSNNKETKNENNAQKEQLQQQQQQLQLTSNHCLSPNVYNDSIKRLQGRVIGSESLPCSRPGSRTTSRSSSPASFISEKQSCQSSSSSSSSSKQGRITAAEALGVIAKPCPRPPSSKRSNKTHEYRRQSLGNLSDSKLSIGYDRNCSISCTIRGLWNSVGETEDSHEYSRRQERSQRASSIDSRTLSRIKIDYGQTLWDPIENVNQYFSQEPQGYGTLSRINRKLDSKYFPRSTTPVQSGYSSGDSSKDEFTKKAVKGGKVDQTGRPKSTCNCGHHIASASSSSSTSSGRVDTGKRTFSVEELTSAFSRQCSEFSRGSSNSGSARSSFGKSPRVTFALAEDSMGASGGAIAKHSDSEHRSSSGGGGGAAKKILRGKLHAGQHNDSGDDAGEPRVSGVQQHRQFQGGGGSHSSQSNRSQPAIGLKQTPKSRPTIFGTVASDLTPKEGGNCRRSLPQTTLQGGVTNGAGAGGDHHHDVLPEPAADHDNALVYRDGNLVSGSLDALVQHMVPTTDYYPDRAYLFAFLLSSRLFIKPHELLGQVTALCDSQQKMSDKQASAKERLGRFIPRLVQLLAEWSETFPYDFRDERVMAHVRSITQGCVSVAGSESSVRQEVSTLLQNLLHRLTSLEKYEEFLQKINAESTTNSVEALPATDVTEVCGSASALAQQLTHIELERLSYIGPEEFVQAFAKDNPHLETSFKDMKKTRNLESYVSWFNRLSYFVATEVVKHVKKKQRVKVVEFWIETARECFNIGNFNSLMAIIAGLNMSPISRLKKTWSKVQSAKFSVLEHQMDPTSNFCNYRSTLKAAMWRSAGATDQSQRIVIPFFSLLVKDLYFLNEGCSNKLPNGHINFEKFWQLAKQVTEFITWKQVACPFEKNTKVITFLQVNPILTENALALASFECEPPENNLEKERCKSLKAEMTLT